MNVMRDWIRGKYALMFGLAVLLASGAPAMADNSSKLSLQRHYVMMLYSGTRDPILIDGDFCPMKNGALQVRANGAPTACERAERFRIGGFGGGTRMLKHKEFIGDAPQFDLIWPRRAQFGRHYFARKPGTTLSVRAGQPTFFYDAEPGTITVIPMRKQRARDALADARKAMEAHGYGAIAGRFKYNLMRAAVVNCGQRAGARTCVLGEEVPYPKLVVIPIIIPF